MRYTHHVYPKYMVQLMILFFNLLRHGRMTAKDAMKTQRKLHL